MKHLAILLSLLFLSSLVSAEKLKRPPNSILGIGATPCSEFVEIYDAMQIVKQGKAPDPGFIAGTYGAYGDYTGTLGGFLASSMMHNGDRKIPFSDDEALSKIYSVCEQNPKARFIDVVHAMSQIAFGRPAP
jgi:hypothetical protein